MALAVESPVENAFCGEDPISVKRPKTQRAPPRGSVHYESIIWDGKSCIIVSWLALYE